MFEQVKQEIDDKIKTNGNNEITATRLNGVLQDMMDATEEELNGYVQKTDPPSPAAGDIVVFDEYGGFGTSEKTVNDFATAAQGAKADTALQPTGVKTINNQSIVGSGNITIEGGGTDDYADLDNKPQINSVALSGNKTASDLGLATAAQGTKADNAIPMPAGGSDEQILAKDSSETGGVKWVPKPSDGKSALQIYNETYGTNLNEAQFIDVLKQNYPMEYVAYNQAAAEQAIGTGFASIDTLAADSTTVGKMYLMPNHGTTPTGTILFVTVQTGVSTYAWYKLGNLNVPSNVLTEDDIANNLSSTDATKALSAKQGRVLSETLGLNIYIDFANQGIIYYQTPGVSDGTIGTSQYYKYSDPIFIKNGWTVNVLSRGTAFGAICTCNQDGTNIQVVVGAPNVTPTPTDYVTYTYTATADCYVIVCGQFYFETHPAKAYYNGDTDFLKDNDIDDVLNVSKTDKLVSNSRIAELNNELQDINEALRRNDIDFTNQGIIHYQTPGQSDGTIGTNQHYKYSDPIFIKNGWTVKVFSRGTAFGAICTCNQDGTNIQVVVGAPNVTPTPTDYVTYTYTATADCYVIVCGQFYFETHPAIAYYLGDTDFLKDNDIDDVLNVSKTDKLVSNSRIAELNNELQDINEALRRNDIDFTNQGIIHYQNPGVSDGTIGTSQYYKYSDPIFIKNGWTVNVLSRGTAFGAINTCNQDGTNIQVVVGAPNVTPTPTDYVTYTYTATADCYVIVCGQFYFETHPAIAYYLGDISRNPNTDKDYEEKTFTAELTMACISGGSIVQYDTNANNEANSRKNVATIYWIEIGSYKSDETIQCTPFAPINEGETYKVYFYNANYSSIGNSTLTSDSQYTTTIPAGTKFIKLFVTSSENLTYSVRYVEVKAKTDLLRWHGVRNFLTTSDYISPVGSSTPYGTTLKYYRTIFEVSYKGQRLWNVGLFFYSPYYKPVGKKTKLAIVYCGSDGYKFNQDWNAFSDNYHSIVFSLVHSGYNVALCSCLASLYGPTSSSGAVSDCSGDQLSINCYQSYYEYLVKNFNVEEEPYLLGYSNGGMPCGRVNVLGDIKSKAIAGGAIVTELVALLRILGFSVNINKILHNCGVPEDVNVEHGGPQFTTEDFEVLKSQGDILKNYSPMFMSCDGLDWNTYIDTMKGVSFTNIETNQAMIELMQNVKIQSEIPIKIWITRDDVNVSYGIEKFYIEAVNRGGGRAFLRTMPNDAGKHAMGNYGNADSIKMQNYHFKDGTVADTTLFMNEVIDWFDEWK